MSYYKRVKVATQHLNKCTRGHRSVVYPSVVSGRIDISPERSYEWSGRRGYRQRTRNVLSIDSGAERDESVVVDLKTTRSVKICIHDKLIIVSVQLCHIHAVKKQSRPKSHKVLGLLTMSCVRK